MADQDETDDVKSQFLKALEKKKGKNNPASQAKGSSGSKVGQGQQGDNSPKMFRRKSGSS